MAYSKWVTDNELVVNIPINLKAIVLSATAAGAATATIYDGINDTGEVVAVVKALANSTLPMEFYGGVHISTGIYVELAGNYEGLLVVWDIADHNEQGG